MSVPNDSVQLSWSVIGEKENIGDYTVYVATQANDVLGTAVLTTKDMKAAHKMPVSSYVAYRVSANYLSQGTYGSVSKVYSEFKVHNRSEVTLHEIDPMDVLIDNNQLYIFDGNSTIAKYDVSTQQIVKQVSIGGTITYPDIAIHNGQKEIYIPRTDGWIYVLNTELDKIDEINVGAGAYSVVYHNGYLYTTLKAPGSKIKTDGKPLHYNLHVYNRTTKQLVNNSNNNAVENAERIKKVPGTEIELYGVVGNTALSPGDYVRDLYYYKYSANGNYLSVNDGNAQYLVTPIIMEMYPDGSKIVTGIRGRRFNKNLVLEGLFSDTEIPETYTSGFGFNVAQNLMYIGRYDRTIDVVNIADNSIQRTIKTIGYPHKIFYEAGNIISVSRNEYPASIGTEGKIQRSPFMVEVFQ